MKFEWEKIKDLDSHKTYRARVYRGWIVSSEGYLDGKLKTECMCFIPDCDSKWEIEDDFT